MSDLPEEVRKAVEEAARAALGLVERGPEGVEPEPEPDPGDRSEVVAFLETAAAEGDPAARAALGLDVPEERGPEEVEQVVEQESPEPAPPRAPAPRRRKRRLPGSFVEDLEPEGDELSPDEEAEIVARALRENEDGGNGPIYYSGLEEMWPEVTGSLRGPSNPWLHDSWENRLRSARGR